MIYTIYIDDSKTTKVSTREYAIQLIDPHYPKMDMVSFGPNIRGAHSPDEKVSVTSVQKFWGYLCQLLTQIS